MIFKIFSLLMDSPPHTYKSQIAFLFCKMRFKIIILKRIEFQDTEIIALIIWRVSCVVLQCNVQTGDLK